MENLNAMTDEQLALLYIEGNNKAFDLILSRNQTKLFSYILFVVRDQDVANDIFQETFVKVITKLHQRKYATTGKFAAWLMRIAHNVIMDLYREQKSERIVDQADNNDLSNLSGDDYIEAPDYMLDTDALLRDDILLELPSKFLCKDSCKGLCPKCGKNLNMGRCGCPEKEPDPRLAALSKLLEE